MFFKLTLENKIQVFEIDQLIFDFEQIRVLKESFRISYATEVRSWKTILITFESSDSVPSKSYVIHSKMKFSLFSLKYVIPLFLVRPRIFHFSIIKEFKLQLQFKHPGETNEPFEHLQWLIYSIISFFWYLKKYSKYF